MQETIIGFDSAWTDKTPGGICAVTLRDGQVVDFTPPTSARFADAVALIDMAQQQSDVVLIALDQPTLVPNDQGIRPVERVAGSVVNRIGGGVQPASRSKLSMFGPDAPIWSFLDRIDARDNPTAARSAVRGTFVIEVFPALALPSLIPEIWQRRRAAKYNPAAANFREADWLLVTDGVATVARQSGLLPVARSAEALGCHPRPRKAEQDHLDALISLLIGYLWRNGPRGGVMVIGDGASGYIVTPVSPEVRRILADSAAQRGVACDQEFLVDAQGLPDQRTRAAGMTALLPSLDVQRKPSIAKSIAPDRGLRRCPECAHMFQGGTWGGIDAHWKSRHPDIMSYEEAWPLIRQGMRPSDHVSGRGQATDWAD